MIQIDNNVFQDFKDEMSGRFDKIDERLEVIDEKLEVVDTKLEVVDARLDKMDERLSRVEGKIDVHFETIGELKVQVTEIALSLKEKASVDYVRQIEERTEKIEGVVFA